LAEIGGFDPQSGLKIARGKLQFYQRLLMLFVDGHCDDAVQIAQLLDRNETAAAANLAHTLKGVAGNVGAFTIGELAGAIDVALKTGDQLNAQRALGQLQERLPQLITALRGALAE
jgi:HPt (histidine-containing phosphotransfer) domain-containing protein